MRDYADERMWASHRRKWKLKMWWSTNKFTLIIATAIILYLLTSWFDEQDRRIDSEYKTTTMALALDSMECMTTQPQVRGYLIASDHAELADEALRKIVMEADHLRSAKIIATQTLKRKP
jgi:hypothetical protein